MNLIIHNRWKEIIIKIIECNRVQRNQWDYDEFTAELFVNRIK